MFDHNKARLYTYASCYRCGVKFDKAEDQLRANKYYLTGSKEKPTVLFLCRDCSTKLVKFLEEGAEL